MNVKVVDVEAASLPSVSATRRQSEYGVWELFKRAPDPRLSGYVLGYAGYRESAHHSLRRREVPSCVIPLIVNFGPAMRIFDRDRPQTFENYGSFVAGLHETFALVGTAGASFCMQADFTPQGALRLLGLPMDEIANRVVHLDDVIGTGAGVLEDRLHGAPSWGERFDILDGVLLNALAARRDVSREVAWAWDRLDRSGGSAAIGGLATEIGWSQKHFISRFRRDIGLPPKTMARILRFDRAVARLTRSPIGDWAAFAQDCGYYDQAHLGREFRAFAGESPQRFARRILPEGMGVID
jgi:AraC-like DNA-binding protein